MRLLLLLAALSRPYHPETVASLPTSRHTHVEVSGTVTLVRREADGDWHIRVSDGHTFVVAEIPPTLVLADAGRFYAGPRGASGFVVPRLGQCVRVQGIRRIDNEAGHGWPELHPVELLEVIPCR